MQQLLELAKDVRAAWQRGEEQNLSNDEIAFYDALAQNDDVIQILGNDQLKVIAHQLLVKLSDEPPVDWVWRTSMPAKMRLLVKGILRQYGYPPDLQDAAVQAILREAEALSTNWNQPYETSVLKEI